MGAELRIGKQHSQKGAPRFIRMAIQNTRGLGAKKILVRLDSGFDAAETMDAIHQEGEDFLIKVNPRQEGLGEWVELAKDLPGSYWERPIPNMRVAYFSRVETRTWEGRSFEVRRVVRVIKRLTILKAEKDEHSPILKRWVDYEADAWYTTLEVTEAKVVQLYEDHGTSEQYHSEIKGELDLERLPSGKFDTNALVFLLGMVAYNLLRLLGILGRSAFRYRGTTKRQRLKTVIQELINIPARLIHTARQFGLDMGRPTEAKVTLRGLYWRLASPDFAIAA